MSRPVRAARARLVEGSFAEIPPAVVYTNRGPVVYNPPTERGTTWKYVADPVGPGDEQRQIKLITEQNIIDKPPAQEGFPMRKWSVSIVLLDKDEKEHPANCFTKVVFNLHPSFENPVQSKLVSVSEWCDIAFAKYPTAFTKPPFKCENEGWGEFEMQIELYYTDKSGKIVIPHDLNFQQNFYEDKHPVTFKNPSQSLQQILRETGPLPADEDRRSRKVEGSAKKQKKPFDVEKMAEALVRLEEDDLLKVIQLIHDHKSDDTYIQNNLDGEKKRLGRPPKKIPLLTSGSIEAGEFSVDLYTLPDNLGKLIWDYLLVHKLVEA